MQENNVGAAQTPFQNSLLTQAKLPYAGEMPVYVDHMKIPFKGRLISHMSADTLTELHDMADRIGMKRIWFQCPPAASYPHHDIDQVRRRFAIEYGAVAVSNRAMLYYAAKLGIEWAATNDSLPNHAERLANYHRVLRRTAAYARREP